MCSGIDIEEDIGAAEIDKTEEMSKQEEDDIKDAAEYIDGVSKSKLDKLPSVTSMDYTRLALSNGDPPSVKGLKFEDALRITSAWMKQEAKMDPEGKHWDKAKRRKTEEDED